MHILSLALGGCLRGEPVSYGITEDTGGHITYILGEMRALARRNDVTSGEIVTRLFDAPDLGAIHSRHSEQLGDKLCITRIDSGNQRYLAKEDLAGDRDAFTAALLAELSGRDTLPDLIHAHFADAADVARRVENELGVPFIYTAHSLGIDKRTVGPTSGDLERRIAEEDAAIRHASAIVGSSRDECERQICAYPSARFDRIHVMVPGIDIANDDPSDTEAAKSLIAPFLQKPTKPIILAIARPVHKKNLATLIEAFGGDPDLRAQCNLVILAGQRTGLECGETEHSQVITDLVRTVDRHDLYGSVAYPKAHDASHVAGMYCLAAASGGVFANPALVEPYGLTICEAAAYGLPVVATNIGGPVDSVTQLDHGVLIDPNNAGEIADAIGRLIDDKDEWARLSANGRRNSRNMDWDSYAKKFMELAQRITRKSHTVSTRKILPTSLVVSDLDNTLTGCGEGARRIAEFFRRRPHFGFVAATGRSIIEAQRIIGQWKLPQPLAWITSTGSEIYWQHDDCLIHDKGYFDTICKDWDGANVSEALEDILDLKPQPCYEQRECKRSYFYNDAGQLDHVREALKSAAVKTQIIASHGNLLDILPNNAGKGPAMQHVAKVLEIPANRVFAIGDSGNDVDMLSLCENAIMVGNHTPELAMLTSRPNVYVARRHHAAGALEGIFAHHTRQKKLAAERKHAS